MRIEGIESKYAEAYIISRFLIFFHDIQIFIKQKSGISCMKLLSLFRKFYGGREEVIPSSDALSEQTVITKNPLIVLQEEIFSLKTELIQRFDIFEPKIIPSERLSDHIADAVVQKMEALPDKTDKITQPIIEKIDSHDRLTQENLTNISSCLQTNTSHILKDLQKLLPVIPRETGDIIDTLGKLQEGHKQVINVLLRQEGEKLTYEEISEQIGISPVTVRVYVSHLKRLGFPFEERRIGKKTVIGLPQQMIQELMAGKVQ